MKTIPMTVEHQRLVLSGCKTLTSRRQRYAPGVYRMVSSKGTGSVSLGCLEVTWSLPYPRHWTDMSPAARKRFVIAEGHDTIAEFEAAARKIAGGQAFLDGEVALIPHVIRAATTWGSADQGERVGR